MCKLIIKFKLYVDLPDVEPLDTIVRNTRRECIAVARAHYKGDRYAWIWS